VTRRNTTSRRAFPWWLTTLAAAALYALFSYYLPNLQPDHPTLASFCQAAPDLAPLLAIFLLLLAAKQLYDIPPREKQDPSVEQSDQPKQ
jgi:uncharacterized membrane protein YdjX (TVP38/TMEM64 family)